MCVNYLQSVFSTKKTNNKRTVWAKNSSPRHIINEISKRKIKSLPNMQGFKRSTGLTYVLGKLADNVF